MKYEQSNDWRVVYLHIADYVFGDRKFGGNAQSITRGRFLHHTSFLWDYQDARMAYLRHPDRAPAYRVVSVVIFVCASRAEFILLSSRLCSYALLISPLVCTTIGRIGNIRISFAAWRTTSLHVRFSWILLFMHSTISFHSKKPTWMQFKKHWQMCLIWTVPMFCPLANLKNH